MNDAVEYAKQRVHELKTQPIEIFGQPVRFLEKADSESFAAHAFAQMIKLGMIDADHAAQRAREGDPLFLHALSLFGAAPPHRLKKLQTGPKRETNYFRDIAIVMLVQELCERFNLKATSSAKAGPEGCACGVAAQALGMSYAAVGKVWERLGKHI